MATWSVVEQLSFDVWQVASDGTALYLLSEKAQFGGEDIYQYDVAGDSISTIIDLSSFYASAVYIQGLCHFNSNLYFITYESNVPPTNDVIKVYEWDGTAGNATERLSLSVGNANHCRLMTDGSQMVATVVGPASDPGGTVRYTSDGSTWSTGSFETYTPREPGNGAFATQNKQSTFPGVMYFQACTNHSGSDSTRNTLFEWDGTKWAVKTASTGDAVLSKTSRNGTDILWVGDAGNFSDDFLASSETPAPVVAFPAFELDMSFHPGYSDTDSATRFYQWNGTNSWVLIDEISGLEVGGADAYVVEMTSGTLVMVSAELDVYSGAWVVMTRSATLPEPLRYLGMDADETNLYVTAIEGGVAKLFYWNLDDLTQDAGYQFGSVDYGDIDDDTAGIYPKAKPAVEQVLYVYGRDGNDVQVQHNDINGTLGWVDVGPGTATWGTAKFATALLPDVLDANDVVVTFSDADVYRSDNNTGTSAWVSMGSASAGLRSPAAVRFATSDNDIVVAGTAAGTVNYTPNFGVSFDADAGGTALGTVYWLAESY